MLEDFLYDMQDPKKRKKAIREILAMLGMFAAMVALIYAMAFAKMWGWY